jgi:hydrogenase expression/formation protein HypC
MTAAFRLDRRWLPQADCEDEMCLAVPGKIVEIYEKGGLNMAKVDFGGIFREACLDYVPEAKINDYCVIHVGFAISLLSEQEAMETLDLLKEISNIETELGPG